MSSDIERRVMGAESTVERCLCEKTGKKKVVIRGYAALFNTDSQDLGGFIERISPGAFDKVLKRGTDVVGLYNHDGMFLLGRESAGTLRLFVDERGLRYEIDPPESRADVVESIERGDVRGSSFAFRVKGAGEKWSRRQTDGMQIREITDFEDILDVGPVLRPAYLPTESFVSRRALEIANDEPGFKPTAGMAAAARAGLELYGAGTGGDIDPSVVALANKIAAREELTPDEIAAGLREWFSANETREDWDDAAKLPWLLRGGDAGRHWSARKTEGRAMPPAADEGDQIDEEEKDSLSPSNFALYEAVSGIAVDNGKWPQEGADGAHYIAENPFADKGIKCQNCVFFNEGGSCDVVDGEIDPEAVCKLWIIPEGMIGGQPEPPAEPQDRSNEPEKTEKAIDALAEMARLQAKVLDATAR